MNMMATQHSQPVGRASQTYRVGLLGLGGIAHAHAHAVAETPGVSITAVCDLNRERLDNWTSRLGCRGYTDAQSLYASDIDLVVVLLPHHHHASASIDAMQAGLHVVIEKPMATCPADCQRMIATAERTSRLLLVSDTSEFVPGAIETRRRYQAGDLGRFLTGSVLAARTYFHADRPAWFLDPMSSGGGMFANVGVHRLAATRAALPGLRPLDVTAIVQPLPEHPVEACTTAMVRYEEGAAMQYQEIGYTPSPSWLRVRNYLMFEYGMVGWDQEQWYFTPRSGSEVIEALPPAMGYQPIYAKAVSLLKAGNLAAHATGSAQDVAIVAAAYRSAEEQSTVPLETVFEVGALSN